MISRAEQSQAWAEGFSAGRNGKSQSENPYIGIEPSLAKEWNLGWEEGSNSN